MNVQTCFFKHPSSYRDPSGYVFSFNGKIYRQVNLRYKEDFEHLMHSGLYQHLVAASLLIPHEQVRSNFTGESFWYTTLEPLPLPFISYPYEWSFEMLKDAALLTLSLMEKSIQYGMILKDASPYNIQLLNGRMIFIDTLSFEKYDETKPWIAYRQFCENFLAPLSLMHYSKMPLTTLFLAYPDGVPLQVASSLLPRKTRWNLHLQLHIHLNSRVAHQHKTERNIKPFSRQKLIRILSSLRSAIESYNLNFKGIWWNYYAEAEQRDDYLVAKKQIIQNWIDEADYKTAFDAGANDGTFSKLLASRSIRVISADSDHFAVEELYAGVKEKHSNIHPLIVDLSNPSPPVGVNNLERTSLIQRLNVDLVMALAVIHHLCIGRNMPFEKLASLFLQLGTHLILEFVPKTDEKVQKMLQERKDIYDWYTEEHFKNVFSEFYKIEKITTIGLSNRRLYFLQPHEK